LRVFNNGNVRATDKNMGISLRIGEGSFLYDGEKGVGRKTGWGKQINQKRW